MKKTPNDRLRLLVESALMNLVSSSHNQRPGLSLVYVVVETTENTILMPLSLQLVREVGAVALQGDAAAIDHEVDTLQANSDSRITRPQLTSLVSACGEYCEVGLLSQDLLLYVDARGAIVGAFRGRLLQGLGGRWLVSGTQPVEFPSLGAALRFLSGGLPPREGPQ